MKKLLAFLPALTAAFISGGPCGGAQFPLTFEVPGHVANQGVYLAVFGGSTGTITSGAGPSVYLTAAPAGSVTSTGSSTVNSTTSLTANASTTSIPVVSVDVFPSSGNLTIWNGEQQILATYNGTSQGNATASAALNGVVFTNPSDSTTFDGNSTVAVSYSVPTDTLSVASTANFPSEGLLLLQSPNWASTVNNLLVSYNGTTATSFTGVAPYPAGTPGTTTLGGPVIQFQTGSVLAATQTVSTTINATSGIAPTATSLPVDSVAGFPTSGNLTLSSGPSRVSVSYNGTNSTVTPNTFDNVVFAPGSPGVAGGWGVNLPNVLSATLPVDSTSGFPSTGLLMLQTPSGVSPSQNILVSYSGTTSTSFTGVAPFPGGGNFTGTLLSGGPVLQQASPVTNNGTLNYVAVLSNQNLPLINLFPDAGTYSDNSTQSATVNLPDPTTNGILSGVAVISVGSAITLPVTAATVGSPTPESNPNDKFGIFEWGLVSNTLDFDVSEVDQVSFPFRSTTTGTPPPAPADPVLGVGMLQTRDELFSGFKVFMNSQPVDANATAFLQGAADNPLAPFPVNTRITAPQDIIGVLQGNPPLIQSVSLVGTSSGNQTGAAYYAVTATNPTGESMPSITQSGTFNYTTGSPPSLQIIWSPYAYASGYNIYWSASADFSSPQLIGTTTGGGNVTFTDPTPLSHNGTVTLPPQNNYGYDHLNSYLTPVIKDFFDYYADNDFVLDDQSTSTKWVGRTGNQTMNGVTYRMLKLTGGSGVWGDTYSGQTLHILEPFFSSNTNNSTYPAPPIISTGSFAALTAQQQAYITANGSGGNGTIITLASGQNYQYNGTGDKTAQASYTASGNGTAGMTLAVTESPSAMAFGADGVFGTFVGEGTTLAVSIAKDVYNNIVSALNRGVTPRFISGNWTNVVEPNYWANAPTLTSANQTVGGSLPPGTYRYWITAVGILNPTPDTNETTLSNVQTVTVNAPNNAVELGWKAVNKPGPGTGALTANAFNVYRSSYVSGNWTTPGLISVPSVSNNGTVPAVSFTDNGTVSPGVEPPTQWYRTGTLSNYYLAYFSQYDVSINGLSYGFAYADKGGLSTNVQMPYPGPTGLVVTLNNWSEPASSATITASGNFTAFSTTQGTASAAQAFTAGGSSLTGNITVGAPTSFEVSSDGLTFASSLNIPFGNGTVSPTSLSVRLAASAAAGSPSGPISLTSPGATPVYLSVNGTVTPTSTPYTTWLTNYPSLTGNSTAGSADPDGDGFTNDAEFAFDGNPSVPTDALSQVVASGGNMTISFVARNTSPAGATYQVQSTTDLVAGFTDDGSVVVTPSAYQSGILIPADYERREFTVQLPAEKKFYRIRATLVP